MIIGSLHSVRAFTDFQSLLQIVHFTVNSTSLVSADENLMRAQDLDI